MAEEEREHFLQKAFQEANDNPNSFNNWYDSLSAHLKSPTSLFVPLPYDWFCWAAGDRYTSEQVETFGAWLRSYVDEAIKSLGLTYPLFLKSSLTSNKFQFSAVKITADTTDYELGDHALNMIYFALMGDQFTNGLVIREYIDPDCSLPTIYDGMPLRTEYRLFYDFDHHKVLTVVPYWERETMLHGLSYLPEDRKTFQSQADRLEREFSRTYQAVADMAENALKDFSGRPGGQYGEAVWSLDFMADEHGTVWFIDAAVASMSAYNEVLKGAELC